MGCSRQLAACIGADGVDLALDGVARHGALGPALGHNHTQPGVLHGKKRFDQSLSSAAEAPMFATSAEARSNRHAMQGKVRGSGHGLAAHHSCKLRFGRDSLQGVAAISRCKPRC